MNSAKAGALAALAWAAAEPIDKRIFRNDYSDVALLGKAVTRSRAWPIAGVAMHAANGAVFGIVHKRVRIPALPMALAEHVALFPLGALIDRDLMWSKRAFAQATFRHALFGVLLGRLSD